MQINRYSELCDAVKKSVLSELTLFIYAWGLSVRGGVQEWTRPSYLFYYSLIEKIAIIELYKPIFF